MGNRLNGFDVDLVFDADGGVDHAVYHDAEGCGHEHKFDTARTLDEVIQHHLGHYRRSHNMAPPKMCGMEIRLNQGDALQCVYEKHGPEIKHRFEL